ncbi:hypothetical protein [Ruminiclostridium cellulolyticum]|uniref:Cyclic nucleotide-binding domain-containing protein n=1 Tax=Ruminiclostridium cellulolyticum (strain ATCC 35319 / DSM 5812 / JCM 6584 / H10) TaxID=394503 RepID=B8I6S8_RUMCH|nr:hypothetical protein [Ruminiclostridium cellulolyticum]ACL76920.1 hypothetical protein Ccel_2592 [Ruminiclostridium cellulolyticum H10]
MGIKSDYSGQYLSGQNEMIIYEGDRASSVILMLQGKLDVLLSPHDTIPDNNETAADNSCRLFTLEQNTFLSVNDIFKSGKNSFSLKSQESCNLYCFPATSANGIRGIMNTQKDYSTYIVSSLATLIDLSYDSYQKLLPICRSLDILAKNLSVYYWAIKDKYYFNYSPDIENLDHYKNVYQDAKDSGTRFFPVDTDSLSNTYIYENSENTENEIDDAGFEYFSKLLNVPLEQRKGFFNSENYICEYHIQKGSDLMETLVAEIKSKLSQLYNNIYCLYTAPVSLMSSYGKIAVDSKDDKEAALTLYSIIEQSAVIIANCIDRLQNEFDGFSSVNTSDINGLVKTVKEKASISRIPQNDDGTYSGNELPKELENSLDKILTICGCTQDFKDSFNKRLSHFRALKDKSSSDSEARELRSSLTSDFFAVYETAFKKAQESGHYPKVISMFLNFGYMDERLVTKEQAISLYRLCDKEYSKSKFTIYSSIKWLQEIYNNRKEPSINDFGQDYYDIFRDMKKRKMVTDLDKPAYEKDFNGKVSFEINNMLKTNQKVCHGHMSSYFPILHKDIITRDLEKSVVTPHRITDAIMNILETDFSVFYREIWYKNEKKSIEKEPIMKEILPDIIIVPTFGSRASMWQEITGRGRNTPGRFIFPAFTDENIYDMVLKLMGTFRWELCRTMMGVSWNDITEKSLTSEYTDYIQFYKKNHDLSEEAKAKIKVQIQKNRNMMKDIFTSDYNIWINYESKGILRLNKIARSILFRYCPLPKEQRTNLAKQPAFSDLSMQLNNSRAKTAKSLTSKYNKLFKNGPMDEDMEANLIFYRDL